jgi:hypothetical protein
MTRRTVTAAAVAAYLGIGVGTAWHLWEPGDGPTELATFAAFWPVGLVAQIYWRARAHPPAVHRQLIT